MKQDISELLHLDASAMLATIDNSTDQLRLAFADEMSADISLEDGNGIQNCLLVGMGGSAIAANVIKNWLFTSLQVSFEIIRGSVLPRYAGSSTLVIISSYSGNTSETLTAYDAARRAGCRILVLCGGGELQKKAQADSINTLLLPKVSRPRLAVFASVKALACVFQDLGWVQTRDLRAELLECANFLDIAKSSINLDASTGNEALELAQSLANKNVLIYASPLLGSAAYVWKISINENAKQRAYYNVYSELNHNEYAAHQPNDNTALVQLVCQEDSPETLKRVEFTSQHFTTQQIEVHHPKIAGNNHLQALLYCILLGEYTSVYLALLGNIDPTPIADIEELKRSLQV